MKKLLASVLCLTFAMSFAACNSRKPEQTIPENSETTVQVTETTEATETTTVPETSETTTVSETTEEVTTETMAAAEFNKKDYIKDKVVKFKNCHTFDFFDHFI